MTGVGPYKDNFGAARGMVLFRRVGIGKEAGRNYSGGCWDDSLWCNLIISKK